MTTKHLRPLLHEGRSLDLFSELCSRLAQAKVLRLWLTWFLQVGHSFDQTRRMSERDRGWGRRQTSGRTDHGAAGG